MDNIIHNNISQDIGRLPLLRISYNTVFRYPEIPVSFPPRQNVQKQNAFRLSTSYTSAYVILYIIILYYCSRVYNTHNIIGVRVYTGALFRPLRISDRQILTSGCTILQGVLGRPDEKKNYATQTHDEYFENYKVNK